MTLVQRMIAHAAAAAILFFLFQRFALGASVESSALWAVAGGIGAAVLAWSQERRDR